MKYAVTEIRGDWKWQQESGIAYFLGYPICFEIINMKMKKCWLHILYIFHLQTYLGMVAVSMPLFMQFGVSLLPSY